ncbi:MAG: hypothetical protein HY447_01035 [Candidatus Omnitrophica bacterium]|nr:hypothetical protein [Candidatus Omnitrophota bacterium]
MNSCTLHKKFHLLFYTSTLAAILATAAFAENPDPGQRYLFYLHGAWIEEQGLNQPHPKHGSYEYEKITRALADRGFVVISEARMSKQDMMSYARNIADQVLLLLRQRVPAENITVIGHSKGGHMALIVASLAEEPNLNFVVMAGCGKRGTMFRRSYERFLERSAHLMKGRILSLYDSTDREAGSCEEAFRLASGTQSKEKILHTGQGHGLFYHPNSAWIEEAVAWAKK